MKFFFLANPFPIFQAIQQAIRVGVAWFRLLKNQKTGDNHWGVRMDWSDGKKLVFLDPGEKKKVITSYPEGSYQYSDTTAVFESTTYVDKQ